MKQQISKYNVILFSKKVIELDQANGEKLNMLLVSNAPKFVLLTDRFGFSSNINSASIEIVEEEYLKETQVIDGISQEVKVKRELTEPEKEIHQKYLSFKGEKLLLK